MNQSRRHLGGTVVDVVLRIDLGQVGVALGVGREQLLENVDRAAENVSCGPVTLVELSETYQVSTTNLKRMFKKAETEELLCWEQPRRRGDLLLTNRWALPSAP